MSLSLDILSRPYNLEKKRADMKKAP